MLFNTASFFGFLTVVLVLFWTFPAGWRKPLLLVSSYVFYMSWNPKFIPLLLALTAIDYMAALWLERVRPSRRKAVLVVSLAANLGFLGFFKYYNFFASNVAVLAGRPADSWLLDIVLPLGISFHTFQSMSYVIDVYRGQQAPVRNATDYALFVAFFPQLVAGPIVRAREFFPNLLQWRAPAAVEFHRGILLIMLGLAKKAALADQLALVVDRYYGNIAANPGALPAWTAASAFALQVYFDFSGYSDMAIGMALLFGFRFPENFRRPFLSDCLTAYWQRWHVTLSRWMRDYLFFPLGGRSRNRVRSYAALLLTLLFAGLWHGAAWHFVAWGGYLGVVLCMERLMGVRPLRFNRRPVTYMLRVPLAFALFVIGTVFFRAADLKTAAAVIQQMFAGGFGAPIAGTAIAGLAALCLVLAILEEWLGWFERLVRGPLWSYASAIALLLLTVEMFSVTEVSIPFVYFQF